MPAAPLVEHVVKKPAKAKPEVPDPPNGFLELLRRDDLPKMPSFWQWNRTVSPSEHRVALTDLFQSLSWPQVPEPFKRARNHNRSAFFESIRRDGKSLSGLARSQRMSQEYKEKMEGHVNQMLEHDPTKSIDVLSRLPYQAITQFGIGNAKSVQILYPGGGSHIAVLELGIRLQQRLRNLERVAFIFTEIDNPKLPGFPEGYFEAHMSVLEPDIRIIGKKAVKFDESGAKRETRYQIEAWGRRMEVVYAIGLSDAKAGDHPFFRKRYAQESDIIMFHDTFDTRDSRDADLSHAVATAATWAAESGRQKIVISENFLRAFARKEGSQQTGMADDAVLPGVVLFVSGEYGCHLWYDHYGGAVVYFPDNQKITELGPNATLKRFRESTR